MCSYNVRQTTLARCLPTVRSLIQVNKVKTITLIFRNRWIKNIRHFVDLSEMAPLGSGFQFWKLVICTGKRYVDLKVPTLFWEKEFSIIVIRMSSLPRNVHILKWKAKHSSRPALSCWPRTTKREESRPPTTTFINVLRPSNYYRYWTVIVRRVISYPAATTTLQLEPGTGASRPNPPITEW